MRRIAMLSLTPDGAPPVELCVAVISEAETAMELDRPVRRESKRIPRKRFRHSDGKLTFYRIAKNARRVVEMRARGIEHEQGVDDWMLESLI